MCSRNKWRSALMQVAGRDPRRTSTYDLVFVVGPTLNAASWLDDMSRGIACLLADNKRAATELVTKLDALNRKRRLIAGFHMHDALDLVTKRHPQLISKFGGHAMAAGLLRGLAGQIFTLVRNARSTLHFLPPLFQTHL